MIDSLRYLKLGFVRVYILYHASHEPVDDGWLIEELAEREYKLSPRRLHSILQRLEKGKLLSSYKEVINGKVRTSYKATRAGRRVFKAAQTMIREFLRRDPSRMNDRIHPARAQSLERRRKAKRL